MYVGEILHSTNAANKLRVLEVLSRYADIDSYILFHFKQCYAPETSQSTTSNKATSSAEVIVNDFFD